MHGPQNVTLNQHLKSSNFRCVLNVVCFLLGNSPVSELYIKFRCWGITQKKAYNI